MRILALDAAGLTCSAALLENGRCLADRCGGNSRTATSALPGLVDGLFKEFGGAFGAVAVTVGPGSFTGLRGALALAHGLGLSAGVPVVGVTVAEALLHDAGPAWVALDARRPGRLFLDMGAGMHTYNLDDVPFPATPVVVVGDAADAVCAARLACVLGEQRTVSACATGQVGARRLAGKLGPCDPRPLYIEEPALRESAAA